MGSVSGDYREHQVTSSAQPSPPNDQGILSMERTRRSEFSFGYFFDNKAGDIIKAAFNCLVRCKYELDCQQW